MTEAVVLGGGLAGLLASSVLARHASQVTVVEGGSYPDAPVARPGVPQARHSHVLVAGGAEVLEALLPGITNALLERGARRLSLAGDTLILSGHGWFRRHDTGAYLIACSRGLLDHQVRHQALAGGAIRVLERTRATGLAGCASRVSGVLVRDPDGRAHKLAADIVIDATGRGSGAPRWLAEIGAARVEETTVDARLAYSTRVYQPSASLAQAVPAIMIHPSLAAGQPGRGATLFPVDGGRWFVTLTTSQGGRPPASDREFAEFARSLRSPLVAELIAAARPASGIRVCRGTANRRRFFERASLPGGFLAIGDALVALNPVYSHGMSVAALGVLRLAGELDRHGIQSAALPGLQAALAAEADLPWLMATSQDRQAIPAAANGPARPPAPVAASHQVAMSRAALGSKMLMTELFRSQTLLPRDAPSAHVIAREVAMAPGPLAATTEAVGQYPQLAQWWQSASRPADGVAA